MISRTILSCASALVIALAFSNAAFAQGTSKILAENEKLQVTDNLVPPGAVAPTKGSAGLVAYYVQGGMTERTFADGTKEVSERKTGETVLVTEKRPYSVKNIGKTTIHVITFRVK